MKNKTTEARGLLRAATAASVAAFTAVAALLGAGTAHAATDVGVSVQISQPGVYGRIDIGRFPQPQVVVRQPVLVVPVKQPPQPIYMWVPPGHRNNWHKHCGRYNACGVPVYFVQDNWYDKTVKPGKGKKNSHGKQDKRGQDHHQHHNQRGGRRD